MTTLPMTTETPWQVGLIDAVATNLSPGAFQPDMVRRSGRNICGEHGKLLAFVFDDDDAIRIAACVNACEGIPTATIELSGAKALFQGEALALAAALKELVACKDIKERIEVIDSGIVNATRFIERTTLEAEYEKRKPLAWSTARAVLARGMP